MYVFPSMFEDAEKLPGGCTLALTGVFSGWEDYGSFISSLCFPVLPKLSATNLSNFGSQETTH